MKRLIQNNIEIICGYDHDLANIELTDFLENLPGYMYAKDNDVLVIADMNANHFKKWKLQKMKKAELVDLLELLEYGYYSDYTKKELIDELSTVTNEQYYKMYCNETFFHNIESTFDITGFSQGDYKKIIIAKETKDVEYINKEMLTNLFYCSPVTVLVVVDGENMYIDDHLEDRYNVNKDDIIKAIDSIDAPEETKAIIKQMVDDNITL